MINLHLNLTKHHVTKVLSHNYYINPFNNITYPWDTIHDTVYILQKPFDINLLLYATNPERY